MRTRDSENEVNKYGDIVTAGRVYEAFSMITSLGEGEVGDGGLSSHLTSPSLASNDTNIYNILLQELLRDRAKSRNQQ